ncbi:MAG: GNAT family N-acetyltransferase [Sedimenticola sp.]
MKLSPDYFVDLATDFTAIDRKYRELFNHSGKISLFLSFEWFINLQTHVYEKDNTNNIEIYKITDINGKPVMVLPMNRTYSTGLISINTLESMSNYYTSFFAPLIKDNDIFEPAFSTVINDLSCNKYKKTDVICLKPIEKNSSQWDSIVSILKLHNYTCEEYFCFGNWYQSVEGMEYIDYFNNLPSRLKNTIIRKTKKLNLRSNFNTKIYTQYEDIKKHYHEFEHVYENSWKNKEPYPEFIKRIALEFSKKSSTRLGILYIDNQPVAACLWFINNSVASIYKLAYIEEFKALSVGTILSAEITKYVINNDSITIIDYLTGDDPYKRDWMSTRRERWGIIAYNRKTLIGMILALRYIIVSKLKKLYNLRNNYFSHNN